MPILIDNIIYRMNIRDRNNIKSTITHIFHWLYEKNYNNKQKYWLCEENYNNKLKQRFKNFSDKEYKDIYDIISCDLYKTIFSFTEYETNKHAVVIYFIKYIYNISYYHAKSIFYLRNNNAYDNARLYNLFIANQYD
jgi:hypothetical protein